ncbi:MAG: hypothetical protein FJW31_18395 [Acidobacteria bacterium]|nr:hypothetical protein [Acidobacteriota bacterium]
MTPPALLVAALLLALAAAQQPPPAAALKPFQATAKLGQPATVGTRGFVGTTKEELEIGLRREVTLTSAELALVFPTQVENIVANANEKLLILRGEMRNPEKTSNLNLGPSSVIRFRLWQRYQGSGQFAFVNHYDQDTLQHVRKNLKAGESGKFVGVWRVPADFTDFRIGVTS